MSKPAREFRRFDAMSAAATPELANMPKGTLPLRHMTSRSGGKYKPEGANPNKGWGYEPFGSDFLRKRGSSVKEGFFSQINRRLVLDAVINSLQQSTGTHLTAENVPAYMVDASMREAFEVLGDSTANAPHATVGPSESMSYLAPPEKYGDFTMNLGQCNDESIARLNQMAARLLRDNIQSEKALLSRFHNDLGGAVHVLEYPSRPPADMRRGHQLNFRYYDDIQSAPEWSGIGGNNPLLQNSDHQSVMLGQPNVPDFQREK